MSHGTRNREHLLITAVHFRRCRTNCKNALARCFGPIPQDPQCFSNHVAGGDSHGEVPAGHSWPADKGLQYQPEVSLVKPAKGRCTLRLNVFSIRSRLPGHAHLSPACIYDCRVQSSGKSSLLLSSRIVAGVPTHHRGSYGSLVASPSARWHKIFGSAGTTRIPKEPTPASLGWQALAAEIFGEAAKCSGDGYHGNALAEPRPLPLTEYSELAGGDLDQRRASDVLLISCSPDHLIFRKGEIADLSDT